MSKTVAEPPANGTPTATSQSAEAKGDGAEVGGGSGLRGGITMRAGESYSNDRRIESNRAWIRMSLSRHVRDAKNLYGVTFKAKNGIEWSVMHRFATYRKIFRRVKREGYEGISPFPPTFLKSKFGLKLSPEELETRAMLLSEWLFDLMDAYENLTPLARRQIGTYLNDPAEAASDEGDKTLEKNYQMYIFVPQRLAQARSMRGDPSNTVDLVEKFKKDLERARVAETVFSDINIPPSPLASPPVSATTPEPPAPPISDV